MTERRFSTIPDPIRRVVTGHDAEGMAVVRFDDEVPARMINTGDALFGLVWTTAEVPVDNTDDTDGARREAAKTLLGGSVMRIVDFKPGCMSPMHRSFSLDYGFVLEGEVDLILDGGDERHLKAGDIVVQRGTNHAWANRTDRWARMAFVLIEAKPVTVAGRVLEEIHP